MLCAVRGGLQLAAAGPWGLWMTFPAVAGAEERPRAPVQHCPLRFVLSCEISRSATPFLYLVTAVRGDIFRDLRQEIRTIGFEAPIFEARYEYCLHARECLPVRRRHWGCVAPWRDKWARQRNLSGGVENMLAAARECVRPSNTWMNTFGRETDVLACCWFHAVGCSRSECGPVALLAAGAHGSCMFYIRGRPSTAIGCGTGP
jgi:hypothetical protein